MRGEDKKEWDAKGWDEWGVENVCVGNVQGFIKRAY